MMIGVTELDGKAVRSLMSQKDDNHSSPASADEALANFSAIAPSFFDTQEKFISWCEQQSMDKAD